MRVLFCLLSSLLGVISLSGCQPSASLAAGQTDTTRDKGREVVKEIQAGNTDTLYARFNAQMAGAVTKGQIADILSRTLKESPIGSRESETVKGPEYTAVHAYGARKLQIYVAFDGEGKVGGLFLKPMMGAN